jgi:RNA polymerase sigma factor (sigma-70 family)
VSESDRETSNAHKAAALLNSPGASAKERERAAKLLFAYFPEHVRRLQRRGWSREDAEDIFTDTVLSFFKNPPRGEQCEAYLSTLLKHRADDRYRRTSAAKRTPDGKQVSKDETRDDDDDDRAAVDPPSAENLATSVSLRDCLKFGFQRMEKDKSPYFEVLKWVALEWKVEEIAERLGISYTAAKDRVFRARKAAAPYFKDCKE